MRALIDAGPIIALISKRDHFHKPMSQFMSDYHGHLISSWPVITESLQLLSFSIVAQINVLTWIQRGGIKLLALQESDLTYLIKRMRKYADIPMDLADASLMCLAEREDIDNIISIDKDFSIYRRLDGQYLTNLFNIQ